LGFNSDQPMQLTIQDVTPYSTIQDVTPYSTIFLPYFFTGCRPATVLSGQIAVIGDLGFHGASFSEWFKTDYFIIAVFGGESSGRDKKKKPAAHLNADGFKKGKLRVCFQQEKRRQSERESSSAVVMALQKVPSTAL